MDQQPAIILVAEDEWLIRMEIVRALADEGFNVVEAQHAAEAIEHLNLHGADVRILFTDIHMPGTMDGVGLAHHTRANWPLIGLILTSGIASPKLHELPDGSRFLPKPYQPEHVLSHVRELIAS
jgi:two-component system, response regulator PdtaR